MPGPFITPPTASHHALHDLDLVLASVVIPIQTLARERFIREQGNLMGELRKFLKRLVKLAMAELLRSGGNMSRLFEQGRGVGADVDATGGRLATQFR